MASRGKFILFADADGATQFSDLDILMDKLEIISKNGNAVVIGSRAHLRASEASVQVNL